ncbi:hypothetical protein GGR32_000159 [Mesonia hippocampi]|uniref:Uncharacterized protein n=1 Tax=Mesonia hippocampi TaxID=1628250 RepID=A0A840ESH0_9FLAO|nr:hypothetical protein [Mesonia hippocampi]
MKKRYLSYQDVCKHPEEAKYLKVLKATANCETTVIACRFCGKQLTEPKTEC